MNRKFGVRKILIACAVVAGMGCGVQKNASAMRVVEGAARGYEHMQRDRIRVNAEVAELRQQLQALEGQNDAVSLAERRRLAGRIAELDMAGDVLGGVNTMVNGFMNVALNRMNLETEKQRIKAQGEADAVKAVAKARTTVEENFKQLANPEMLGKLILLAGGISGMYYLTKFAYAYAEAHMSKPSLVRETSRGSFTLMGALKNLLNGEEEEAVDLGSVVLSPEIERKVRILADDIKQTHEFGLPYQNVMFYGPPGTGKTEFARLLSRYSEMDYAILSGADFSQFKGGEGIVEMHKLFDWGQTSDHGLIIFIDEADACLRDRSTLDKDGVNLVNAFLSRTGANSDKYMFILATNYEEELDSAVRSRIHKKVPFLLPTLDDRAKIIQKKLEKYIINDERTYTVDGQEIAVSLTLDGTVDAAYLAKLAQETEGFSGRDLDQMVAEVRLRAYRSGENLVTQELMDLVARDKKAEIAKDQETTAYQRARAQAQRQKLDTATVAATAA